MIDLIKILAMFFSIIATIILGIGGSAVLVAAFAKYMGVN